MRALCSVLAGAMMVCAPQWENVLAPAYREAKWTHLDTARHLRGVNAIYFSVMDEDGRPNNVDILAWSEGDFLEGRGFAETAWKLGLLPVVGLRSGEHNTFPEWAAHGDWRPLDIGEALLVVDRALEMLEGVPFVACLAEEGDFGLSDARAMALRIREARPDVPIAMVNPHSGAPRSRAFSVMKTLHAEGLLDFVMYQSGPFDDSPVEGFNRFQGAEKFLKTQGIPFVMWETYNGLFPEDVDRFVDWNSVDGSLGASVYTGHQRQNCNDLNCPDVSVWGPAYRELEERRKLAAKRAALGQFVGANKFKDVNGDGVVDAADLAR